MNSTKLDNGKDETKITDERIGVATRLFINERQVGDDSMFMDYYKNIEDAVTDTRCFYGTAYEIESIEVKQLPRWHGTESVPTLLVRLKSRGWGI